MRGGIAERSSRLALVAACVGAAVLIALIAAHTSPIADDYSDIPEIGHAGVFQYLHSFWLTETDRYSDALFMLALIKTLGAAAIHAASPLLLAVLFACCFVAARAIGRSGHSRWETATVAGVVSIAVACATPSVFDTLGWFNAISIYLAGVVAATATFAWTTWVATRAAVPRLRAVVAGFIVGFIAAGFTELIGMVIALGSLLAVANVRAARADGPRRRALACVYSAVAAGSTAGVLVILLGPGSDSRLTLQRGGFDISRLLPAIQANLVWAHTFGWDLLACAAAGVLVFRLRAQQVTPRAARWLSVWCLFAVCVPMLVADASTAYAGGRVAAPRTMYVATAGIGIGAMIFAYVIAAASVSVAPRLAAVLGPAASAAFGLAVVGLGLVMAPIISAEQLRQAALRTRAQSIRRQLALHRRSILITPAPLVVFDASAADLTFEHHKQFVWVVAGLRQYYGVPSSTTIRINPRQPRRYCIDGVTVTWAGVRSCQQLAAGSRTDRSAPATRAHG